MLKIWFDRNRVAILSTVLVALVLFAYLPAINGDFIWDDLELITQNRLIHDPGGLWQFWFSTQAPDYFPLTSTTWWLEWRLWGAHSAGYHAVNLLLHAASAVLIWQMLTELELPGAFLAAAIWAVHPVQVESVAWIAERKNTLSVALAATSMLLFLRNLKHKQIPGVSGPISRSACTTSQPIDDTPQNVLSGLYIAALLTFAAALLAKTSVAPLPLAMLAIAIWRGRTMRRALLETIPFFAITLVLSAVTIFFQSQRSIASDVVRTDSLASRIAIAGRAVWFYLGKLIWPTPLSFVYPRWATGDVMPRAFIPLMLLGLTFILLFIFRRKWGWIPLLGMAYFVLMLLPVLGLINIYFMRYSLVADHWQYAASIGPIAIAAMLISRAPRKLQYLVSGFILLILIILSERQSMLYRSGETLWRDTIAKNPSSWMVYTNLGRVLETEGRPLDAIPYHEIALRLAPELPDLHENVGVARTLEGRFDEAEIEFRRALALKPDFVPGLSDLAKLEYFDRHNVTEAERLFVEALRINPQYVPANYAYGVLLEQQGRLPEAADRYRAAAESFPDDFDSQYDLGSILLKLHRPGDAIVPLQAAARLQPTSRRAWTNLRAAYSLAGQPEAAAQAAREQLRASSQ